MDLVSKDFDKLETIIKNTGTTGVENYETQQLYVSNDIKDTSPVDAFLQGKNCLHGVSLLKSFSVLNVSISNNIILFTGNWLVEI